jgi:hypothetical protein
MDSLHSRAKDMTATSLSKVRGLPNAVQLTTSGTLSSDHACGTVPENVVNPGELPLD